MAFRTTNDLERAETLTGSLAVSGVATSLAASAAELLQEDPERELNARFVGALETVRDRFKELVEHEHDEALLELLQPIERVATETELVAQLAPSVEGEGESAAANAVREFATLMLEQVNTLLENPTQEAAEYVEEQLGRLSDAEIQVVAMIHGDRLEAETFVIAHHSG